MPSVAQVQQWIDPLFPGLMGVRIVEATPERVVGEMPTASAGSSQAPTAAVDNSAPLATRPQSTYKSGMLFKQAGPLLTIRVRMAR